MTAWAQPRLGSWLQSPWDRGLQPPVALERVWGVQGEAGGGGDEGSHDCPFPQPQAPLAETRDPGVQGQA